ncbi:MAG TPA: zinc-dependent alcohol dehydrogenase [Gammaproteobacteria bacterium]
MRAVVFHGAGDIRLEDVPEPKIEAPTDAIVRLTTTAICGTDLHFVRGTVPGLKPGTIIGHEGVGVVEAIGPGVRNLREGDRVVVPSTICCGVCSYCRAGYFAQCDNANPKGHRAGTAFYGGPESAGAIHGLQAEKARIPFAHVNLVKLPDAIDDEEAILLSDIFPTGYFGAELAHIHDGSTVAVFGCGPVGQFAIASAKLMGAGRIFAIDHVKSRLEMARSQGAEVIDFDAEDPIEVLLELTSDIGVDRAIDAVGVDAELPQAGPAKPDDATAEAMREEAEEIAERPVEEWHPGDAPSQALRWAVEGLAKAGTLSIIGVYPENDRFFPLGKMTNKNLTVRAGNCNHRKYIPKLIDLVVSGQVEPTRIITQRRPLANAIEAYHKFDAHEDGWVKVVLEAA